MKIKKAFFIFLICLVVGATIIFSGNMLRKKEISITLTYKENVIFDEVITLSPSTSLNLALFYKSSLKNLYKDRFYGNPIAFWGYLNSDICEKIEKICNNYEIEKNEPFAKYVNGKFDYYNGKNGIKINVNKTLENLIFSTKTELAYQELLPEKSIEDIKKETVKISSFSTYYGSSGTARKSNIKLACDKLDGSMVKSGMSFSFNDTVGKRTKENGFFEAKVIVGGEYTKGIGGGVCQVSTTLYNAWLICGQDVMKSCSHSLSPTYVKCGLDAMVSENSDLVLQNNSDCDMYIGAECNGNYLTIIIYGREKGYNVELNSKLIKETIYNEYEIIVGEEDKEISAPKNGTVYKSYRTFIVDNEEIIVEELRTSHYLPQKGKKIITNKDKIIENGTQYNQNTFTRR